MQFIMSNIFNLIENFIDIINNKYCLIMCAKYYSSSMNDGCTICLADIVSLPAKGRTADCILFEKEIDFCTAFVSAIGQPTWESAHGVHLEYDIYLYKYIYAST